MNPRLLIQPQGKDRRYITDEELSTQATFDSVKGIGTKKCLLKSLILLYLLVLTGIIVFGHFNEEPEYEDHAEIARNPWLLLGYVPLLNLILLYVISRYALSSLMYPYQNSIIREGLDRINSSKFGEEFTHYLDSFLYTLRIHAGQNIKDEYLNSIKSLKEGAGLERGMSSGRENLLPEGDPTESDIPYDQLSVQEMANVFDLITLYKRINTRVMDMGHAGASLITVTNRLAEVEQLLKKIMLSPRMFA